MSLIEKGAIRIMFGIAAVFATTFSTTASSERPIGPSWNELNKYMDSNYTPQPAGTNCPGRDVMICILPDDFVPAFQFYAAWKHKSGTFVKIVKFSDIGVENTASSCSTSIKPFIENAYKTWKYRPSHVLLVGDAGVFPLVKWNSPTEGTYMPTNPSEEFFAEYDSSNRYEPDVLVGRLPVKDSAQMVSMLKKIMNYECTPATASTDWFKRVVAISSNQQVGNSTTRPTFQVETVREVSKMMVQCGISVDTLMCDTATSEEPITMTTIINAINKGCTWINYRGQGWAEGWRTPCYQFYGTNVNKVLNAGMCPVITGIGCGISMFNTDGGGTATANECFSELMLRLGTEAAPRGAIAVIGPTGETHSYWNNTMDKCLYEGIFKHDLWSPGHALVAAIDGMYKDTLNKDTSDYLARLYNVLGDPSTHVWKDVPQIATVTGPTKIPLGTSEQTFSVKIGEQPVRNAEVCVSGVLDDSVTYVTGFTDSNGSVKLSIDVPADQMLSFYTWGTNIIPIEQKIMAGDVGVIQKRSVGSARLSLMASFPNPSLSSATISYTLPEAGLTTIAIYSLHGALIRVVVSEVQPAGVHSIAWNGRDNRGMALARGVYLVSLHQANRSIRQRLTKL